MNNRVFICCLILFPIASFGGCPIPGSDFFITSNYQVVLKGKYSNFSYGAGGSGGGFTVSATGPISLVRVLFDGSATSNYVVCQYNVGAGQGFFNAVSNNVHLAPTITGTWRGDMLQVCPSNSPSSCITSSWAWNCSPQNNEDCSF